MLINVLDNQIIFKGMRETHYFFKKKFKLFCEMQKTYKDDRQVSRM